MGKSREVNTGSLGLSGVTRPTIGYLAFDIADDVGTAIWTGIADAAQKRDVNLICFVGEKLRNPNGFLLIAQLKEINPDMLCVMMTAYAAMDNAIEIIRLQHLLQSITNSMPSVLIALDMDGQVLLWNPAAEALTGQSAPQVLGQSLWQICPGLCRYRDLFEQALQGRQIVHRHSERLSTESGVIYCDVDVFPLSTDYVEGAVLRIDDVTGEGAGLGLWLC